MDDEQLSRLERIAKLRDSGALSQDEFEIQKSRLTGAVEAGNNSRPLAKSPIPAGVRGWIFLGLLVLALVLSAIAAKMVLDQNRGYRAVVSKAAEQPTPLARSAEKSNVASADSGLAEPNSPTATSLTKSKMEKLFRADTLNLSRSEIEQITGSGITVFLDEISYDVEGCDVEIIYRNNAVQNILLKNISRDCTFSISAFFPGLGHQSLSDMTFGDFYSHFNNVSIFLQCLGTCGNAADPSITAYHPGARYAQFVEIQVSNEYPYRGSRTGSKFDALYEIARRRAGDREIYNPDCDTDLANEAAQLFSDVEIKSVRIGSGLDVNPARC